MRAVESVFDFARYALLFVLLISLFQKIGWRKLMARLNSNEYSMLLLMMNFKWPGLLLAIFKPILSLSRFDYQDSNLVLSYHIFHPQFDLQKTYSNNLSWLGFESLSLF